MLDGEEYADDMRSGECLQAAWLANRPEATNFGLIGLETALKTERSTAYTVAIVSMLAGVVIQAGFTLLGS